MPNAYVDRDRVHVGKRFSISLQRTLRIPDDGREYPLPPALGKLPVRSADAFKGRVPPDWLDGFHFLAPMHRMEAMWLAFNGRVSESKAVKVGAGNVNVVSGAPWDDVLRAKPQDYLVCPYQRWLDGINAGDGKVRQFVAVPFGDGLAIEEQVSPSQPAGGIRVLVVEPAKDLSEYLKDVPPAALSRSHDAPQELGMAAGGWITQRVYPDPFGIDVWDQTNRTSFWIHLVTTADYSRITDEPAPPPVIDAATYARYGMPWFEVYDETRGDVPAPAALSHLESLNDHAEDEITPGNLQVRPIPLRKKRDGK